jgi:hypothetical protein
MEQTYGDPSAGSGESRLAEHAAELAYQYHRSAALPGAERGVDHALAAADRAEAAYARDEAAAFLQIALELLPEDDARRPRLLGRLGLALAWALAYDEALKAASEAGDLIAATEGNDAAADFLAEGARTLSGAGFQRGAWALGEQGLRHVGDRRDAAWVWLTTYDLMRREAQDPDNPGIPLDSPERDELKRIAEGLSLEEAPLGTRRFSSREDVLARAGNERGPMLVLAGEYRRALSLWRALAVAAEQQGGIAGAMLGWAYVARCHNALGDFAAARDAYQRGEALGARLGGASLYHTLSLGAARYELVAAQLDDLREEDVALIEGLVGQVAAEDNWALAAVRAIGTVVFARVERGDESVRLVGALMSALERAPGWALNYPPIPCDAAEALWLLERSDHIEVIERNLREKVIAPDFRYPMRDGRLSLACLCALQGRYDEAVEWFAKARTVLEEQGARPLRAIVDFDQALMYHRRDEPGAKERAAPLLEAALAQFRELGMSGWIRRAESLR